LVHATRAASPVHLFDPSSSDSTYLERIVSNSQLEAELLRTHAPKHDMPLHLFSGPPASAALALHSSVVLQRSWRQHNVRTLNQSSELNAKSYENAFKSSKKRHLFHTLQ
jgi:hypothetical protein